MTPTYRFLRISIITASRPVITTRYHRAVVVHQTALAAAGFDAPAPPNLTRLFGKKLIDALRSDQNKKKDVLSTVWARAAKEGGKMNLGMVLATQAPSSVLPEILSETDNWFISHLNSDNEAKVVERYLDFAHFIPQIRRVSEPGFIRLRTLSSGYTVPVQLDRFRLPDAQSEPSDDTGTLF